MGAPVADDDRLLTPADVAALFRVHTYTVRCWANTGKLTYTKTLRGHHRYRHTEIMALIDATTADRGDTHQGAERLSVGRGPRHATTTIGELRQLESDS